MGVIKGEGQYKLMWNTNPTKWNRKKGKRGKKHGIRNKRRAKLPGKRWTKHGIRNKRRAKSPGTRAKRKVWSKLSSKAHKNGVKHT